MVSYQTNFSLGYDLISKKQEVFLLMDDNFKMTDNVEWLYLELKEQSQKPTHRLAMTALFKYFRILYIEREIYIHTLYMNIQRKSVLYRNFKYV